MRLSYNRMRMLVKDMAVSVCVVRMTVRAIRHVGFFFFGPELTLLSKRVMFQLDLCVNIGANFQGRG